MTESNYRMIKEYKLLKDFRKYLDTNKTYRRLFLLYGSHWEEWLEKRDKAIFRLLRDNASKTVLIRDIWECCYQLAWKFTEGYFTKQDELNLLNERSELFARLEEIENDIPSQDRKRVKGIAVPFQKGKA